MMKTYPKMHPDSTAELRYEVELKTPGKYLVTSSKKGKGKRRFLFTLIDGKHHKHLWTSSPEDAQRFTSFEVAQGIAQSCDKANVLLEDEGGLLYLILNNPLETA